MLLVEKEDEDTLDYVKITDDDIAYALSQEAKAKAIIMMQNDLRTYISKMGNDASFKGWIAHICPENVAIDVRLEMPGSSWHALWEIEKKNSKFLIKSPTSSSSVRDFQIRAQSISYQRRTRTRSNVIPKANRSRRNRPQ